MKAFALLTTLAITFTAALLPSDSIAEEAEAQKAVLVTGASTGIGRSAAERLAAAGYFVYAGARKAADIDALNKIDNIKAVRLDVTKQDEIDAAVALVEKEGRGLWGLVNNAGVNVVVPLIEASESEFKFLFDVNVFGVFRVTKAFAPLIIKSKGRIVNISSISGFGSGGGYGIYSASKHALEAMTDSLSDEMEKLGVTVVAVEPGNFASEIGLTRCKRRLADTDAKPYVYFEERRQQQLAQCKERVEAGIKDEGTPPDAVAATIQLALFEDKPKPRYMVVPEQIEAGWVMFSVMGELLELNARHDHSYSRDELVTLLDTLLPYASGENSFNENDEDDEMRKFFEAWATRQGKAAK